MSLLLFFHPSPVINQHALTPAVVQRIVNIKPVMFSVERAQGQFQTSTIEYSSSSNEYNTGLYGGADRVLGQGPVVFSIDKTKPKLYKLGKI